MPRLEKTIEAVFADRDIMPDEVPQLDLYMDQVLTLFDQCLSGSKRTPEDKLLTKTMVNNYVKEGLMTPVKGKKYTRQQIMQLLCVYHLKQTLRLNDVKALTGRDDVDFAACYEHLLADKKRMREAIPPLLTAQLPETPDDPEEAAVHMPCAQRNCKLFTSAVRKHDRRYPAADRRRLRPMSIEKAKAYLRQFGAEDRVIEFPVSSATVELAAEAVHCEPARIAKTLSFRTNDGVILIVAAGDTKIDNPKYKARFGCKARMLAFEEVEPEIGHAVGGVCPFGVNDGVTVYLDESLRRFETVFPACGSSNSAIEVTIPELEKFSGFKAWVDVCKGWREA